MSSFRSNGVFNFVFSLWLLFCFFFFFFFLFFALFEKRDLDIRAGPDN